MDDQPGTAPMTKQDWIAFAAELKERLSQAESECERLKAELSQTKEEAQFLTTHDVTEWKGMEDALVAHQEQLATIFEAQQDVVLLYDPDMNVVRVNPVFEETYGFNPVGLNVKEIVERVSCRTLDGQPLDWDEQPTPQALQGKKVSGARLRVKRFDGSDQVVETSSSPIRQGKDILGSVTVWHDITEQQQMRQTLQEANTVLQEQAEELEVQTEELRAQTEELIATNQKLQEKQGILQGILDATKESIWLFDPDGVILVANETALSRFHHSLEEVIGKNFKLFVPEELVQERQERLREVAETRLPLEFEDRRAGIYFHHNFYPILGSNGTVTRIASFSRDITERKQTEEALQARQKKIGEILESISDAFYSLDQKGCFTYVNRKAASLWQKQPEDLIGKNIWEVFPEGKRTESYEKIEQTLVDKQPRHYESYSAAIHQWVDIHLYPTEDGISVYFQDITERKNAEEALAKANANLEQRVRERTIDLERTAEELETAQEELLEQNEELAESLETEKSLRQQLIQAEKFAALSRLLGSVAHEINNPLQTVKNSLYLLTPAIPAGEMQSILEMAIQESRRIGALVQQLHETYQPSEIQIVEFNQVELLTKVHTLLEPQLKHNNVQWQLRTDRDPFLMRGIPDQIQQVCMNICTNAIDAMGEKGGQLTIDLSQPEAEKACIAFHDTGPGIPESAQASIFEPFYTTKEKGLGLGLAICQEIVKSHGGEITVESKRGEGTTFFVWLPVK